MSHRSRRGDDQDRSHSSHRYEKYEHRHRRDDSRDRDYYHSKSSSSRRDKYRSRSRSPSYSSKSYTRHHRNSRSRSPVHSSRHYRSRSRSPGYSNSRHQDDYHRSHHRSRDHKDDHRDLRESKSRDSREHSQSRYNIHEKFDTKNSIDKPYTKHEEVASNNMIDRAGSSAISSQTNENAHSEQPKTITYDPNDPDAVLEEEKQRIQRETLERLQKHLEAEGKSYPPKKPQASHPIFANDGSFLEMFKTIQGNMQQQQHFQQQPQLIPQSQSTSGIAQPTKPTAPTSSTANSINRFQPINRRRGAKILKTGIVQKQRVVEETDEATAASNDSWNAYLKEVKRYKTVTCSDDNMTRSLVK
ncbi:serine/arginine-rich splicing factor 4 [Contarinia nasturtii]|uniref:serine/arginine-rich splicing factor 4 n=1 Tax=Contarinia nasturtii TaxID=265458 RepID=UPI0012D46B51|nr:serine/arginine-rich splicing factor 4 [Contarinia nasturtii]